LKTENINKEQIKAKIPNTIPFCEDRGTT